jgi:hypothetical protein
LITSIEKTKQNPKPSKQNNFHHHHQDDTIFHSKDASVYAAITTTDVHLGCSVSNTTPNNGAMNILIRDNSFVEETYLYAFLRK